MKLDLTTVVITVLIVLVGTVLAFTMFLKGTSLVGPARGNMLGCVEPLMATVCSAVFLDTGVPSLWILLVLDSSLRQFLYWQRVSYKKVMCGLNKKY